MKKVLEAHPRKASLDVNALALTAGEVNACAQTCTACADACLGESDIKPLLRCIKVNQDCADACHAAANMLVRFTEWDWDVVSEQLRACAEICRICAAECRKHASKHAHCAACADTCDSCTRRCMQMVEREPVRV